MKKSKDDLGDRMKMLEMVEAGRMLMPLLPTMIRLDGRSFHSFTRGLKRPYDERMSDIMIQTTKFLVEETNACIGYTQSDEISLVLNSDSYHSQIFFDGRIQKLNSVIAALASVRFNKLVVEKLPEKSHIDAVFDCRVWNVPTKDEAVNNFIWRENDAVKNSVSMAARAYFSHKQVDNKTGPEKHEMLYSKGVNWNDYPPFFKRGTYVQRVNVSRKFTAEEIEKLPPKHAARKNPDLIVERSEVRVVDMPKMSSILNRIDVIFNGDKPIFVKKEEETFHE